jgi:hypothetical protein
MKTIQHLEHALADAFAAIKTLRDHDLLPRALEPLLLLAPAWRLQPQVTLCHGEDETPLEPDAPADSWDKAHGGLWITFEPRSERQLRGRRGAALPAAPPPQDPLPDLVRVLDQAEKNPMLQFVALKLLRDRLLPQSQDYWAASPDLCQQVIADAIERGVIATGKAPNPRMPDFPVTTVRLERDHPEVAKALAQAPAAAPSPDTPGVPQG